MFKSKIAGILCVLFVVFLTGCNDISDSRNVFFFPEVRGQVGSLTVSTADDSRSVDVNSILFAKVTVSSYGLNDIYSDFVSIKNGKNTDSIQINNIPVGNNKVVTVRAYTADSESGLLSENEIVLRTICNINSGTNITSVNRRTTALGNVFHYLNSLSFNISSVKDEDVAAISAVIDGEKDYSEINSLAIVMDYKNGGVSALKSKEEYVIGYQKPDNLKKIIVHVKDFGYQNIYAWTSETEKIFGAWPGKSMEDSDGDGWYDVVIEKTECKLIFNGTGGQTQDLSRKAGEWWYENNSWRGTASGDTENPSVQWLLPKAGKYTGSIQVLVSAMDNVGVQKIEFYAGEKLLAETNGDGSYVLDTAALKNGSYNLYAKVYDFAGNMAESEKVSIIADNVHINKVPVAVISAGANGTVGISKSFSGSSSTDDGEIVSYAWDFGDGATGTGENVNHNYTSAGEYTVTLLVTDDEGASGTSVKKIKIAEPGSFQHRDFREETVYFMMTDRFCDGDKTNNNIWGDEYLPNGESQMYDYSEDKTGVLSYYHGGDFKGIINNLDYIADMGFTAIWITPSVKQPEGRYYYDGSNGGDAYQASAFHGYWGYDFDQIDPHLHSSGKNSDGWDDFKAFVDACHAKGIRVMQDIVINHGNHTAATAPTKWVDYSVQTIMDGKKWAWKVMDEYYDPDNLMNGFYAYKNSWQCADLIDFGDHGEDGKDARHHMINVYKKFIDAGVDAFRIDTMAYITNEWAGEFADAMYNHAKELGNDYFYMIGEPWCGRYDAVARHSLDSTDSLHMLDMHLSCLDYPGEMYKVFGGSDSIGNVFNNATSADKNVIVNGKSVMTDDEYTKTAMFVDNHDSFRCNGRFSEAQYKNALNYIYLFRGVPIVYYGTEACYSWEGAHASTNKEDVVSRWMLGDRGINYVKTNKPVMYKHLKVLNEVYHSSECIQKGAQDNVSLGTIPAAFTRQWNGKKAAVILNHQSAEGSFTFSNLPAGSYTLYTSASDGVLNKTEVNVSGSYKLVAPANGFAVLDPK